MIITHDTSDCHADRGWYTRYYAFFSWHTVLLKTWHTANKQITLICSVIGPYDTKNCHADKGWYTRDYLFPPLYWKDNYLEWSCLFFFYY